jgi:hypothetical protein
MKNIIMVNICTSKIEVILPKRYYAAYLSSSLACSMLSVKKYLFYKSEKVKQESSPRKMINANK